jgi:predicted secreted hydrolase
MKKKYTIPYREKDHGDFNAEWPPHRKVSGWWYITGYLADSTNPENYYSYQYTLLRARIYGVTATVLQLAFTDFQTGQHFFKQRFSFQERKFFAEEKSIQFPPLSHLKRGAEDISLSVITDEFSLDLNLDYGKGAFWHGDDGVLVMGEPDDPVQRTVYYSYPNMPTTGEMVLRNSAGEEKTLQVTGKSWFDRQWGPYRLVEPATHWEWFSLRFFDDEEVMLFAFPQHPYYDGTYIDKAGNRQLVRDYTYTPKELVEVDGFVFSKGWDLVLPGIKEERYQIRPIMDGQMNLAYYELLAEIINPSGERVGFCFVELLPGVRNPGKKPSFKKLFVRV